jgi:5'-methylthioadenosine phosphorylase
MDRIAVIGGTGMEQLPPDYHITPLEVETKDGTVTVYQAQRGDTRFVFLSRHGANHQIAPHQIDYRANISALLKLGITRIFATNAVGSLRLDLKSGSLVLLSDFLDFTRKRSLSYWESDNHPYGVVHTDFSAPYCSEMRDAMMNAAKSTGTSLVQNGIYLCAEGPRFESPAEVRLYASWGADVVGMTGLPEAVFAREVGICYAGLAIVTNPAAGLTEEPVDHEKVTENMKRNIETVRTLILNAIELLPESASCECHRGHPAKRKP